MGSGANGAASRRWRACPSHASRVRGFLLPAGLDHYVAQAAGKSTTVVEGLAAYPAFKTPPVLYEFEACPYCRFVREAITALDLVVDVKPCGRGSRHRAEARKLGGKEQFPLLVDGDTVLYESADIVDYLAEKRGVTLAPPTGGVLASAAATAFRPGRGDAVSAGALAKPPRKLLELYSYEGNQFCRLVREVLRELDLQYPVWKSKFTARSRHRRDACSMAWRCRFLAARPSQDGRVIAVHPTHWLTSTQAVPPLLGGEG